VIIHGVSFLSDDQTDASNLQAGGGVSGATGTPTPLVLQNGVVHWVIQEKLWLRQMEEYTRFSNQCLSVVKSVVWTGRSVDGYIMTLSMLRAAVNVSRVSRAY